MIDRAMRGALELRTFQERDCLEIEWRQRRAWKAGRVSRLLLVGPSGSGKTVTAVAVMRRYLADGKRVLVLVHGAEILEQTYAKLVADGLSPEDVGVIWRRDRRTNPAAPVQIASVMTMGRREAWPFADLIVIDEAHHVTAATWRKILGGYRAVPLLGLTATPTRPDGKPLGDFFDEMIMSESPPALINLGYLAEPEVWTVPGEAFVGVSDLKKIDSMKAQEEIGERMARAYVFGSLPAQWTRLARGAATMCFAASIKQAKVYVDDFNASGVVAELLTGATPMADRRAMIGPGGRLESGATKVVVTVGVANEGWDATYVRCVVLARPTASIIVYLQQTGRGMRPGATSVVLDHVGNYRSFGLPHADRTKEWSLDSAVPKRVGARACIVREDGRVIESPIAVPGELVPANEVEVSWGCGICGRPSRPWRSGRPTYCATHRYGRRAHDQAVCAGWDGPCPTNKEPGRWAFVPSVVAYRAGEPWRCKACAGRKRTSKRKPDTRPMLEAVKLLTREQRSLRAKKREATMGADARAARSKRKMASLSLERRSEIARKGVATRRAKKSATAAPDPHSTKTKGDPDDETK